MKGTVGTGTRVMLQGGALGAAVGTRLRVTPWGGDNRGYHTGATPRAVAWGAAVGTSSGCCPGWGEHQEPQQGVALWGKTAGTVMGATLGVMPCGGTVGTTLEPLWG